MRIGFDAKRAFNNQSGLGNYSRNLLSSLHACFPDNEYILFTPKVNTRLFDLPGNVFKVRMPETYFHKLFPSYWRSFAVSKLISRENTDIFHGLSHELPYGIQKSKVKSVVTIHDLIFLRYPELYSKTDRFIYKKKFQYACNKADLIISVSRQTSRDIVSYFGIDQKKIEVVYQGCNPVFFNKVNADTRKTIKEKYKLPDRYILFVGTIEKRKNLLSLVKAMNIGRTDFPLVVIGHKTSYFRQVTKYIRNNNLRNISFNDTIKNEDLPAIYQMADAFVYPSLFEGFGIPVLESLFSGTPVITSKGGCFAEAGGPKTIYVDPLNPEEIAEALCKVLNDKELRKQMIDDGLKYADNFTPDKTAHNMMQVYEKLLYR